MDHGIVVDLETTGLDPKKDKIIEIGILEFALNTEETPAIVGAYSALQDPGQALSDEVAKITGLKDTLLAGRSIDWGIVRGFFSRASIVIAHNAKFDSAFLKNSGELSGIEAHWACSVKHIPWNKHGFKTNALNYLAADHGFVNPFAHRALFDCATTFRLIEPYMGELIQRSYEKEYMLHATGAPFEKKDNLRLKGYRWDPNARCWQKHVLECDLDAERAFLAAEVYGPNSKSSHQEVLVDPNYWSPELN